MGFISENKGHLGEFIMDIFFRTQRRQFFEILARAYVKTYAVNFFKGRFVVS